MKGEVEINLNTEQIMQALKKALIENIRKYLKIIIAVDLLIVIVFFVLIVGGDERWTIASFVATFLSMIAIVIIFYVEQNERAKEREYNIDLMRLVNFINSYISIEDTLMLSVEHHYNQIGIRLIESDL